MRWKRWRRRWKTWILYHQREIRKLVNWQKCAWYLSQFIQKPHLRIKLNLKKKSSACELFIDTIGPPAGPKTGHRWKEMRWNRWRGQQMWQTGKVIKSGKKFCLIKSESANRCPARQKTCSRWQKWSIIGRVKKTRWKRWKWRKNLGEKWK